MRTAVTLAAMALASLSLTACKVNKTEEGRAPSVKVSGDTGKLPEYNVQGPKVDVGSKKEEVKVPTVKVKTP